MRKLSFLSAISIVALILASCGTSNHVVSKHSISKRKYTKGLFIKKKSNLKSAGGDVGENVAYSEPSSSSRKTPKEKKEKIQLISSNEFNESESIDENINVVNTENSNYQYSNSRTSDYSPDQQESAQVKSESGSSGPQLPTAEKIQRKISEIGKNYGAAGDADLNLILLVILAIIIPPLAVFLFEGTTKRFWIDLILAILGFGLGFGVFRGIWWILGLISVIYALLIVLSVI